MNHTLHDDPRMHPAWSPWFSHEYITYCVVRASERIMAMPKVAVQPNPFPHDPAWPVGPNHVDLYKESSTQVRHLDGFNTFDYAQRNGDYAASPPADTTIEPWKVLVLYCTEPDLQPDCDLKVHRFQTVTGGSHGWRHMQFKALGLTLGMAPESFRHHLRTARRAFALGNAYWGWRFLSRATHYLADLGHPFHVKAAPLGFTLKNLFSFASMFKAVSAVHTGYEVYSETRFRQGFLPFREALARGAQQGLSSGEDIEKQLPGYIIGARRRLDPVFGFMLERFGPGLLDVYSHVVHNGSTDVSNQTKQCSVGAYRLIFQDAHRDALEFLDRVTAELLHEVGRMLGLMLKEF